ncbi:TetR/AcrR family transcriptional regulator [Streptomyces sp. NPDC058284]|uniref:TetR/AcrR family transcriptional regulator n=1 Tax=unclassified Streptomyces TaxID=2593676 RepID=UPI00364F00E0
MHEEQDAYAGGRDPQRETGEQPGDERLLWAVASAMRELGPRATMAQLAREVGEEPAVLYRRFPTIDVLRESLAAAFYDRLFHHVQRAQNLPVDQQLEYFLRTVGLHLAASRGVLPDEFGQMASRPQRERVYALTADLLATAQQAGLVPETVSLSDLAAVIWALRGIIAMTETIEADAWERHLDLVLAGLKSEELTFTRPPMGAASLDAVINRRRNER